MRYLKQSTAVDVKIGPFLDSTDGITAETGLTISQADVRLAKNNGAWAQKTDSTAATHEENGWYEVPLDATDTATLGVLMLAVHESGALPVWHEFMVVPANVWDSLFGADKLQVHADEITAGLITATAIAADAITAAKVAADVTTEIQSGLATASALATVDSNVDAVLVDTGTTLPATLATIAGYLDTEVSAILEDTGTTIPGLIAALNNLDAAGVRTAVGLASANLDTQIGTLATAAALATVDGVADGIKLKTDGLPSDPADASVVAGLIAALPTAAENAAAVLTTAMTESYSTGGGIMTVAQALYEINQMLQEKGTASTTLTVKKRDGSTAAMTFTLDSATAPTSITRAT